MDAERPALGRRIVMTDQFAAQDAKLSSVPRSTTIAAGTVSAAHLKRNRSTPRSAELLAAIARIDTEPNPLVVEQIMDWIRSEYAARGGGELVGLFSRCYLGPPYVDHVMTISGFICEHYAPGDEVAPGYRSARALAANPAYEYVEVYDDATVIPVRSNGKAIF